MTQGIIHLQPASISDSDLDGAPKRSTATLQDEPHLLVRGGLEAAHFLGGLDPPEPYSMRCQPGCHINLKVRLPLDRYRLRNTPLVFNPRLQSLSTDTTIGYHAIIQIELQCGTLRFHCNEAGQIVVHQHSYRKFRQRFLAVCAEYGIDYPLPEPPPRWWRISSRFADGSCY